MTADIKALTARLCELCEQLFDNEWEGKYNGKREEFRDWLNEKTGLNVDHLIKKEFALQAWISKLEEMATA
jgi:hypothetical protein